MQTHGYDAPGAPLSDDPLLVKLLEGRFNREHQAGFALELQTLRDARTIAGLRQEVDALRGRVAELENQINQKEQTIE